jgi:ABC-2 type transport system ATP-binding protein
MNNSSTVISVKGLNKSFGEIHAVIDFFLELKKGDVCGFLGPNGAGKTTVLRMLCGLIKPDSGSGHCMGYDIIHNSTEIKKFIGYMPQKFSLYPNLTVYDNLDFISRVYGLNKRNVAIQEVLQMFNLKEYKNLYARELSGGLKQRLALAGCLLHKPQILLLDEPTGGVDSRVRRQFWEELFKLSEQGITSLISTHYMDEAERCTHLVYLSQRLIAQGTISDIIRKANLNVWMTRGDNLMQLAQALRHSKGVEEAAFFGEELHVSGKDETLLIEAIKQQQNYHWKKIEVRLEDAFMSLIDTSKDGK